MSKHTPTPDPDPEPEPVRDRPSHQPGRPEPPTPERPDRPVRPDLIPPASPLPPSGRQARDAAAPPATALTSILPASAAVGDPDFMVRVGGTGFTAASVIVFAGQEEPTTFVSDSELTTGVNMSLWLGPDPAIPVLVRTPGEAGAEETNTLTFVFTEPRAVPLDVAYASQPTPAMDLITRV